jgi:excisionase family DNA binding protein
MRNGWDLVNVNEAARLTGLDKSTLYKLARQGRVRSFKVLGSALRFDRTHLQALVAERQSLSHDAKDDRRQTNAKPNERLRRRRPEGNREGRANS